MSTLSFRLLILASLLCVLGAVVVDLFFPDLVPEAAHLAIEAEAPFKFSEFGWFQAILVLWVGAFMAGAIGMLFFRKWARTAALWATGVGFVIHPLLGPSVFSGWAFAFTDVSSTLWGAVIALAYFSSISSRFGPHADH